MLRDVPDTCKFVVTLPKASSVFDDYEVGSQTYGKEYKKVELPFILTSTFVVGITAQYQSGGAFGSTISSGLSALNSFLSEFGVGLISQRAAVLTYQGSKISGFKLSFILLNDKDNPSFLKSHLDHIYRAVLPTFGTSGDLSIDEVGAVSVVNNVLSKFHVTDNAKQSRQDILKNGGVITKALDNVLNTVNEVSKEANKDYVGLYGFTAPLSYSPANLSEIDNNTVSLNVGGYFNATGMIIQSLNVTFSKEVVRTKDNDCHPLYAEGDISFEFVKALSHSDFRKLFFEKEDESIFTTMPVVRNASEQDSIVERHQTLAKYTDKQ